MTIFVTVLHVLVCIFLIVVVLLQRGKGAEVGAVFGGGGGSTVFGSRGAGNFLTRLTTGSAVVFMITSLTLAYVAQDTAESTLFDGDTPTEASDSPFGETGETAPAEESSGSPFEEVAPPPAADPTPAGDGAAGAATNEAPGLSAAPEDAGGTDPPAQN